MQIRLECYGHERDAAVARISDAFRVKSVSKAYPNARDTGTAGTPCESRYYIKLEDRPFREDPGVTEVLAMDMLRFLKAMHDKFGTDFDAEAGKLRAFYASAGNLTDTQKFQLLAEWKAALLARCLEGG